MKDEKIWLTGPIRNHKAEATDLPFPGYTEYVRADLAAAAYDFTPFEIPHDVRKLLPVPEPLPEERAAAAQGEVGEIINKLRNSAKAFVTYAPTTCALVMAQDILKQVDRLEEHGDTIKAALSRLPAKDDVEALKREVFEKAQYCVDGHFGMQGVEWAIDYLASTGRLKAAAKDEGE